MSRALKVQSADGRISGVLGPEGLDGQRGAGDLDPRKVRLLAFEDGPPVPDDSVLLVEATGGDRTSAPPQAPLHSVKTAKTFAISTWLL